jgi:predicted Co/Zn/Cd cation transporter (cation efflux family)
MTNNIQICILVALLLLLFAKISAIAINGKKFLYFSRYIDVVIISLVILFFLNVILKLI